MEDAAEEVELLGGLHDKYSHMMDALRYAVQATSELDFFEGQFFDVGSTSKVMDYTEDWSGVWQR